MELRSLLFAGGLDWMACKGPFPPKLLHDNLDYSRLYLCHWSKGAKQHLPLSEQWFSLMAMGFTAFLLCPVLLSLLAPKEEVWGWLLEHMLLSPAGVFPCGSSASGAGLEQTVLGLCVSALPLLNPPKQLQCVAPCGEQHVWQVWGWSWVVCNCLEKAVTPVVCWHYEQDKYFSLRGLFSEQNYTSRQQQQQIVFWSEYKKVFEIPSQTNSKRYTGGDLQSGWCLGQVLESLQLYSS